MGSLHFSGSPWFLLLLVPGLWILWRQHRAGAGMRGWPIAALQGAALLLLVASLTGPEWVRSSAEFHDPALLILRDRSGSFRGGDYLGLGDAYARAERDIAEHYRGRGFEVTLADFHEIAWREGADRADRGEEHSLTSLAAAADFADSAGGANLQAVFLFSDGRANLDSGKASRDWPAPVYPVAFPEGISEAQPEAAAWGGEGGASAGSAAEEGLEVSWRRLGNPSGAPAFRILQGNRAVHSGNLSDSGDRHRIRVSRIPWKPGAEAGSGPWRLVLRPGGGNPDPYNDTVPIRDSRGGRGGRRVEIVKPLRSLDEKGMADILHGWSDASVAMVAPEDLPGRNLGPGDQVWVEAGLLASRPALLAALRAGKATAVVYARPGSLPAEVAGAPIRPLAFSRDAEVRPARAAADVFPDAVVRLKSVASAGIPVPAAGAPWREAAALTEGGRRGLLLAWFPLAPGRQGIFLALPPAWDLLFDPQADFAVRENLDGLLRAASRLAERQEGAVKAVLPHRVHAGVPFELEFTLPPPRGEEDGGDLEVKAHALGAAGAAGPAGQGKAAESWRLAGPGPETFRLEGASLPEGRWILELERGGRKLWSDSLISAPKASLELARIGFDREALREMAVRSGGGLIEPDSGGVTSLLPELRGAQIRSERTRVARLHNTLWQFLLAVGLLASSWLLRKRWNLD